MRVVVVREYTDKYTGEGHVIGEKLDMTEERFAEIQDKGMFVVDISDEVVQQETPAVSAEPTLLLSYSLSFQGKMPFIFDYTANGTKKKGGSFRAWLGREK